MALDMSAVGIMRFQALSSALKAFSGAVVVVSHNTSFVRETCNELWVVGKEEEVGEGDKKSSSSYIEKNNKGSLPSRSKPAPKQGNIVVVAGGHAECSDDQFQQCFQSYCDKQMQQRK